jgi:phosphatidylglycerol:prolipoprotein diacylglycerol transferase
MYPRIGPIAAYGILYLAGIVVHFLVSWRIAKRYGLKRRVWIAASTCYLIGMMLGAKLLYDLRHGVLDIPALFRAEHYIRGGLWGGLLAYLALAVPTVPLLTKHRLAALDLLALSIPVPWILAKLGCLLNGCCYGKPCSLPWAITFPEGARGAPAHVPLHPTQLHDTEDQMRQVHDTGQ